MINFAVNWFLDHLMIAYSPISINIDLQFLVEFSVVRLITDLSTSMIGKCINLIDKCIKPQIEKKK